MATHDDDAIEADDNAPASSARPLPRDSRADCTGARALSRAPGSFKQCGCGIYYSRATWENLRRIGMMDGRGETIELRECTCGSTIAVLARSRG
jgi:hypothetical protein